MPRKVCPKKQHDNEFDDGRTIADMNVAGMPWYTGASDKPAQESDSNSPEKVSLTKKDKRALIRGVALAALLAGGVFFVAFAVFILFCIYVWFR